MSGTESGPIANAHHIVLSTAVFPGTGQMAQKRFKTALTIMLLFSISIVGMFYFMLVPTIKEALHLIRIGDIHTPLVFQYKHALPWGFAAVLIYLVNVWDIRRA